MKTLTLTIIAIASFISSLLAADTKVINTPYGVVTATGISEQHRESSIRQGNAAHAEASQRAQIVADRKASEREQFAINAAVLAESSAQARRDEAASKANSQLQADARRTEYQERKDRLEAFRNSDAFKIMSLEKRLGQARSNRLQGIR